MPEGFLQNVTELQYFFTVIYNFLTLAAYTVCEGGHNMKNCLAILIVALLMALPAGAAACGSPATSPAYTPPSTTTSAPLTSNTPPATTQSTTFAPMTPPVTTPVGTSATATPTTSTTPSTPPTTPGSITPPTSSTATPPTSPATSPTPTAPVTSAYTIIVGNFLFQPFTLTVPVGTTVTWQNKDSMDHTATSDTGVFDIPLAASLGQGSYTFTKAGTYNYHCAIHTEMTGVIIVKP